MVKCNMANTYKKQQIMTSSSEELILMLYNGAIRFISESIVSIEEGNIQQSHNANLRAQDIVNEFMISLDPKYEISKKWLLLYKYIMYCLFQGNIKKNKEQLIQAKALLSELREGWVVAMKMMSSKEVINSIVDNTSKKLWIDYLLLTKEMIKFLEERNMDVFYKLMNQRKRLQEMIDHTVDDDFSNSDEGRGIRFEIESASQFIANTLQFRLNDEKKEHQVLVAYDNHIGVPINRMSWEK